MDWAMRGPVRGMARVGTFMAAHAGGMGLLAYRTFAAVFSGKVSSRAFLHQLFSMGVQSLPLVMVTADPLRHRDLAAGRLPVHGLDPALRAGQRRHHRAWSWSWARC